MSCTTTISEPVAVHNPCERPSQSPAAPPNTSQAEEQRDHASPEGVVEPPLSPLLPAYEHATGIANGANRALGVNPPRESIDRYLTQTPSFFRLTDRGRVRSRTLRECFDESTEVISGGALGIGHPKPAAFDEVVNVTVLELGDAPIRRLLRTLDDLANYLNSTSRHPSSARVFIVSHLSPPVVGILGSTLAIDPNFFARHVESRLPLELSLPSAVAANESFSFQYKRNADRSVPTEKVSLYVANRRHDNWTAVFLTNSYSIRDEAAMALAFRIKSDAVHPRRRPSLNDAIVESILGPIYFDAEPSPRLPAVVLATLHILLSEWTALLSALSRGNDMAEDIIREITLGNPSSEAQVKLFDQLRLMCPSHVRSPRFYKETLRLLDDTARSVEQSEAYVANLESSNGPRMDKVKDDLRFLIGYATQLRQENEKLAGKVPALFAERSAHSGRGEQANLGRSRDQQHRDPSPGCAASVTEKNNMPPGGQGPPPFSEFPGVAHNEPPTPHENSAGQGPPSGSDPPGVSDDEPPASCQNSDGQGPPSGPDPPGVSLYEPFARHIQTKIDQIAYVTNDLLSLTLIATIYGMNLDIFVDGGLSDLKKYLVTALPFAAGIFFLTFYLPTFRLSTFRLKSSPTRRGRNVNVDVV